MLEECFAIYCYSLKKIQLAPIGYNPIENKSIGEVIYFGAWIQLLEINDSKPLKTLPNPPPDFKPKIFSYSEQKEMRATRKISSCKDNVFIVLMPGYNEEDMNLLSLILDTRYRNYFRKNNIKILRDDIVKNKIKDVKNMKKEKKYQVFISSTYTDLIDEKKCVFDAIWELNHIPAGMENFSAGDEKQWEVIKKVINESDYYILILGFKYGSTTSEGISFTQKEYEYALEIKKPILSFFSEDEGKNDIGKEIEKFRETVLKNDKMAKFWNSKDELATKVVTSLTNQIKTKPGIGWVRGDQINSESLDSKNKKDLEKPLEDVTNLLENQSKITLSEEANSLLFEASQDQTGTIIKIMTGLGLSIQTHGLSFVKDNSPRTVAKWSKIIENLVNYNFIEEQGRKGEVFKITHSGYEYCDRINKKSKFNEIDAGKHVMEFDTCYYWEISEKGEKAGPYCSQCYENNNKKIHLIKIKTGLWECKTCKNSYCDSNYKKRKIVQKKRAGVIYYE